MSSVCLHHTPWFLFSMMNCHLLFVTAGADTPIHTVSLSTVVLSIEMVPMPAIVDVWGYDVQNCSCSSSSSSSSDRSTPITQKQIIVGVLVSVTTRCL